ncbi:carbonic anhydrase-related protein B isoform X1 [Megalopta genalis]|uniref:carbonic anhydrase-related protein B isoform X1 n=1 Tax=Megalopta genalis TaxID=115081 RepID=UPI0014438084|nr:carbonic anhydrase-related protein 10-like isoform X1 [Megalopta genalis]XP_033333150.1 carbonic anhydrase-related protein 10-like isoform X1 [Megalopta genalis]
MAPFSSVFLGVWGVFVIVMIQESRPFSWEEWWTYDGISGPGFWGLINPEWCLCNKGKRQSPVNLEPSKLLFDPNLRPLQIDKHRVGGVLENTGHRVAFAVDNDTRHPVNISGGPLSYRYQFHEIHLHFGLDDRTGSEHTVDGHAFPAELQIFGFNSQLYNSFSDALHRAQGIVAVSLLLQVGDLSNPELRIFTEQLDKIKYRGQTMEIKRFAVRELLPDTKYYMTYDGSITMPACHETTTWIILNKPIYITKQQLLALRVLMRGVQNDPVAPLGNNYRPPQQLHHRPVRTNIDFNVQRTAGNNLEEPRETAGVSQLTTLSPRGAGGSLIRE